MVTLAFQALVSPQKSTVFDTSLVLLENQGGPGRRGTAPVTKATPKLPLASQHFQAVVVQHSVTDPSKPSTSRFPPCSHKCRILSCFLY